MSIVSDGMYDDDPIVQILDVLKKMRVDHNRRMEAIEAEQAETKRHVLELEQERNRTTAIEGLVDLGCGIPRDDSPKGLELIKQIGNQCTAIAESLGDYPKTHKIKKMVTYRRLGVPERRESMVNTYKIEHLKLWVEQYRGNPMYWDAEHPAYLGVVAFPKRSPWTMPKGEVS